MPAKTQMARSANKPMMNLSIPLRLQPELDQAADGLGARWLRLLLRYPRIERPQKIIMTSHHYAGA